MTVNATALMLCGQFAVILLHDVSVEKGSIKIVPTGKNRGISINPEDVDPS